MKGALVAHTVEHKWRKAERLLSQPDIVMPAPSADKSCKAFSVLSESVDAPNFLFYFFIFYFLFFYFLFLFTNDIRYLH